MVHDNAQRYGLITRSLHWSMAALLIWQLTGMVVKLIVGRTPLTGFWVGTHTSTGVLLFILIIARVCWALFQRRRRPPHTLDVLGRFARAGHIALYILMLLVPLLAVMRMIGNGKPIRLFGLSLRSLNGEPMSWLVAPANAMHGLFAWLLLVLIAGHLFMAAMHAWVWHDQTFARILGAGENNPS